MPHNILDKFYLKWSHIGKIKKINSGSKEEKSRIFRMHELNLTVDKGRNRFISSVQFHHLTTYGNVNTALRDRVRSKDLDYHAATVKPCVTT